MKPLQLHHSFRDQSQRPTPRTEPVVPMINVVFLILVSFLLAAHFSDPAATAGRALVGDEAPTDSRTALVLSSDGALAFAELRGPEALSAAAATGDVRLETGPDTEARVLARVLTALAEADAARVDLVTLPDDPG